jgi:hypothetical protein
VSYVTGAKATLSDVSRCSMAARPYLGASGLMYPGFAVGEYGGEIDGDE